MHDDRRVTQRRYTDRMKTGPIRSGRAEPEVRADDQALLTDGATVSELVEAAVRASVRRRLRAGFIARGQRPCEEARRTGDHADADRAIDGLRRKRDAARTWTTKPRG